VGAQGHPEHGQLGKFSSDRTIAEYTVEIWHAKACPLE
jgi:glucan phosphorylase